MNTPSKAISATKLQIIIDSHKVENFKILAYTLINGEEIDWDINREDFETWSDDNDLRTWYNYRYNYMTDDLDEDFGIADWSDVYADYEMVEKLLTQYIQFLYDQEALDIETPIAKITSTHKKAI